MEKTSNQGLRAADLVDWRSWTIDRRIFWGRAIDVTGAILLSDGGLTVSV